MFKTGFEKNVIHFLNTLKKQHLFEMEIFCNIILALAVFFFSEKTPNF